MPPPGWEPDPAWPDPPEGWQLWVEDAPATGRVLRADSWWAPGGGAAVCIGALLPWVSVHVFDSSVDDSNFGKALPVGNSISGDARAGAAVFGLILIGLAIAIQSRPARGTSDRPRAYAYGIPLLVLSVVGILGCGILAYAGIAGFREAKGPWIAGYRIFTLAGAGGIQGPDGTAGSAHVSFTPSVGLIMIFLGCAAAGAGGISSLQRATPLLPKSAEPVMPQAARIRDRSSMTAHDAGPAGLSGPKDSPPGPKDSPPGPPQEAAPELDTYGLPVQNRPPAVPTPYRRALTSLICGIVAVGMVITEAVAHYKLATYLVILGMLPGVAAALLSGSIRSISDLDKRIQRIAKSGFLLGYLGVFAWVAVTGHGDVLNSVP
jgi:hypothetical protein